MQNPNPPTLMLCPVCGSRNEFYRKQLPEILYCLGCYQYSYLKNWREIAPVIFQSTDTKG